MRKLPLLALLFTVLFSPSARATNVELVGFHIGSEYFILTEEINSDDFRARQIIFVLKCTFNEGQISGINEDSIRLRVIPEGSTSGISYSANDLSVLVTEVLDDRTALLQISCPYDVNVLGTKAEIQGEVLVILEEEEKQSRPIQLKLEPGFEIMLDTFPVLLSGVEIPKNSPYPLAITFRMSKGNNNERKYSVQFFDEKMRPIASDRSDYVIDDIHEATYNLQKRPSTVNAVFKYVGVSKSSTVKFNLDCDLNLVNMTQDSE
ncbi:hypothetical protein [Puniceicoccus vermicola]|uniref:Uncharacterized protein n=1 Tax=Puniceicoccus vermicola TaxID=388746 RepID=A0A7X1AXI0_9BACT|nr:hypothetical protein [Puniceicoccus vermicola]MBC2601569.1 hypothetical protein [Puniceicoccus vermicola]